MKTLNKGAGATGKATAGRQSAEQVSELTTNRLSVYLRCLNELDGAGVRTISSQALAEQFHLNAAQIRKDLAYFGEFGVRGVGYYVRDLKRHLRQILGLDRKLRYLIEGEDKRIVLGLSHDGDVNFDGVVDIFDINAVSSGWGTTNDRPDADGNNAVDIFDINMISSNWGNNVNGPVVPVPEPSSIVLGGLAMIGLVGVGRRIRGQATQRS